MSSPVLEMMLFEDGRCEKSECPIRAEDYEDPLRNIVSRKEFEQLQDEHAEEAEGVTYEEYCETERECWNEMAKHMLSPEWDRFFFDELFGNKKQQKFRQTENRSVLLSNC